MRIKVTKYIILISLLFIYITNVRAVNPITSFTQYTGNNGFVLTQAPNGYNISNACITQAGNNYYITYGTTVSFPSAPIADGSNHSCIASVPTNAFPGPITNTGYCLPDPPISGVDSCSNYFQLTGTPQVFFDPFRGKWHAFVWLYQHTTNYVSTGHLTVSGSADVFPLTGWTYEGCQFSSVTSGTVEGATTEFEPLAGGGYIVYVNGYEYGPYVNGVRLPIGIYYQTNTDPDLSSSSWSTPALAITNSTFPYSEFSGPFVYGNTFYLIGNMTIFGAYQSSQMSTYLYSASSQTSTSWTVENSNLFPWVYVTSLSGYSLNSGIMIGMADINFWDMIDWQGIGAFTITATPISNPQPILYNVSSSFSGNTLIVSGTVALGNGSTPLWAVGLHNLTQSTYSQATWDSWGTHSPGTVSNTFSGTIAANAGDSVVITAYNVGRENSSQTITIAGGTTYSIAGTISGAVQSGVTINLTGTSSASTTIASDGTYSFAGLAAGSYTITPSKTGYTFSPASLSPTITTANVTGENFTASAVVASGSVGVVGSFSGTVH